MDSGPTPTSWKLKPGENVRGGLIVDSARARGYSKTQLCEHSIAAPRLGEPASTTHEFAPQGDDLAPQHNA